MNEWEQKGYDAWVRIWTEQGCTPTASLCPARYMNDGQNRQDFIRGWNRAKAENQS